MTRIATALGLMAVLAVSAIVSVGASRAGEAKAAVTKGLDIAIEADRRDSGFSDFVSDVTMVLRNRNGAESRRRMRIKIFETEKDGDRSLITFSHPRDIRGTALLTYSHKTENDDQWIYLPAIKRVKRISSTNRSGPFVGSEFSYEDLVRAEVEKYTYRWIEDGELDGVAVHVVERIPAYRNSGYTREVVWYDRAEFRIVRIDYYDRKKVLLKTYTATGYRRYLDRFWRPDLMDMVNHQNGKSTQLRWQDYRFRTGLSATDFNKSKLQRLR